MHVARVRTSAAEQHYGAAEGCADSDTCLVLRQLSLLRTQTTVQRLHLPGFDFVYGGVRIDPLPIGEVGNLLLKPANIRLERNNHVMPMGTSRCGFTYGSR